MADTLISPPEPMPHESPETGDDYRHELPAKELTIASLSQKILFNVLIPTSLLMGGIAILLLLGTAQTEKKSGIGADYGSRMQALSEVRVEHLHTLASHGGHLELVVDGSVVPFREARVATEVSGEITKKSESCEAGAYVKAGDFLMQIDSTDYDLEAQRLEEVQKQEYQALREIDQEKINTGRSIDIAKQDLALQQNEVKRQNQLRNGFTSPAERDKAQRAMLAATQQLVTLENQLSLLDERRLKLQASQRLAATQLLKARKDVDRTTITAPISGVIVNENVDLHSFVARGTTLVTIDDTSKAEVATSLRMDQLYWVLNQAIEPAEPVQPDEDDSDARSNSRGYKLPKTQAIIEYELSGRKGVKYYWNANLLSYDGIGLNSNTRTVPVRVVVDNPNAHVDANGNPQPVHGATALVRGMYVKVKLLINPKPDWIVIPAKGLQVDNRILQFIPDPSVLAIHGDNPNLDTTDSAISPKSVAKEEPANEQPNTFAPKDWVAGKVVMARGINPIAPLTGSASIAKPGGDNSDARMNRSGERLWVCEIDDKLAPLLRASPFVVVSPFEDFSDDSSPPARAAADVVNSSTGFSKEKQQAGQDSSTEKGAS